MPLHFLVYDKKMAQTTDHKIHQMQRHPVNMKWLCTVHFKLWSMNSATTDYPVIKKNCLPDVSSPLVIKRRWYFASVFQWVGNNAAATFLEPGTTALVIGHDWENAVHTGEATALSKFLNPAVSKFVWRVDPNTDTKAIKSARLCPLLLTRIFRSV